jgi:hypothetical protein
MMSLPSFPGNRDPRIALPSFRSAALLKAASKQHPRYPNAAFQGLFVSQAELCDLEGNANTPPYVEAGARPQPPAANAAGGSFKLWENATTTHDYVKGTELSLKYDLISAIEPHIFAVLDLHHATTGLTRVSARTIMAALDTRYGTFRPHDHAANAQRLLRPFVFGGTETRAEYVATHVEVHLLAARHGETITDLQKVRALQAGLTPCGRYAAAIERFHYEHQTVASCTFSAFIAAIEAADLFLNDNATTSTMQLSAATMQHGGIDYAALAAALAPHLAAAGIANAAVGTPAPATAAPNASPTYCWSHYICKHPSAKCKHPKPGHKKAATFTNRMGGADAPPAPYAPDQ